MDKFEKYNIDINGIAVTDISDNSKSIRQYDVKEIDKYDKTDVIIISLADMEEVQRICNRCIHKGYLQLYYMDKNLNIVKYDNGERNAKFYK